tara:strand:- start:1242 stop:1922 length:681 start_codon:yes stop_codon:yes gene_type:complete
LINSNISGAKFAGTVLDGANISGCMINNVTVNNLNLRRELVYKEIGYFQLVSHYMQSITCRNELVRKEQKNYTTFLNTHSDGLTSSYNRRTKRYIDWFESLFIRFSNYHSYTFSQKLLLTLSVIFTKAWSSFSALACSGFTIILLFAFVYFFGANNVCGLSPDDSVVSLFTSAFYFSVVTFTTLGFGEIHPCSPVFKLIVILEVILGYIILGSFVFMIGHRANKGF